MCSSFNVPVSLSLIEPQIPSRPDESPNDEVLSCKKLTSTTLYVPNTHSLHFHVPRRSIIEGVAHTTQDFFVASIDM